MLFFSFPSVPVCFVFRAFFLGLQSKTDLLFVILEMSKFENFFKLTVYILGCCILPFLASM